MDLGLLERIRSLFGVGGSPHGDRGVESNGGTSVRLFRCPDCETTYLGEDMSSCPECDGTVIEIPSERDLGFGSGGDDRSG